ncbi:MAG: hypothetical protein ACLFUX_07935 [Spirochaetaceae bacterium]
MVRALAALVLWIPAFVLSAVAGMNWPVMFIAVMLFGTRQGLMLPTVMLWVDRLAEKRIQATASSLLPVFGFLGRFVSTMISFSISRKTQVRTRSATGLL